MYLQKEISRKIKYKTFVFVDVFKANDENSRVRIRVRIRISLRHGFADPNLDPHQNVMDQQY
jgi:hypothetical protein